MTLGSGQKSLKPIFILSDYSGMIFVSLGVEDTAKGIGNK